MKKYLLIIASILLVGCTEQIDSPNNPNGLPSASPKVEANLPDLENHSLSAENLKIQFKLPTVCQVQDNLEKRELQSAVEMDFAKCQINDHLSFDLVSIQDQNSISTAIDNFISNHGKEICIDGPETCSVPDWQSKKEVISREKSAFINQTIPELYHSIKNINSRDYLIEVGASVPGGTAWRNYITYVGDQRIVLEFSWDYYFLVNKEDFTDKYLAETNLFVQQLGLSIETMDKQK